MNRAGSHEEFSLEKQSQLSAYLEQHSPSLADELTMLSALYETARWKRVEFGENSSTSRVKQRAVSATDCAEANGEQSAKEDNGQSSSSSGAASAIAVFVPLRVMESDGTHVLSKVNLSITLDQPHLFPGEECSVSISVKSANISPELRENIAAEVRKYSVELRESSALTIASLAARCEELLLGLPVSVQATHFGCCLQCCRDRVRNGLEKTPSPLRVEFEKSGKGNDDDGETAPTALSSSSPSSPVTISKAQCLHCRSELVVFVPSLQAVARECSFCCVDDYPMIKIGTACSCYSCFDCFCRLSHIADGIYRGVFGWRGAGVACPNHRRNSPSIISDPGLLKLLPLRTLLRLNTFTIKDFAARLVSPAQVAPPGKVINYFACNNPDCAAGGVPQILNVYANNLGLCVFCMRATCMTCGNYAIRCECKTLAPPSRRYMSSVLAQLFERESTLMNYAVCALASGDLVFIAGGQQIVVKDVPLKGAGAWPMYVENDVWCEVLPPEHRKRAHEEIKWVAVFQGVPMRPDRPLCMYGVYPGAMIFVIPFCDMEKSVLADEMDLWQFRRSTAAGGVDDAAGALTSTKYIKEYSKKCPFCGAATVHSRGHGCHHIYSCPCRRDWCYACCGPWPCTKLPKCPLFCNSTCGCLDCTECKVGFPCPACPGCSKCRPAGSDRSVF